MSKLKFKKEFEDAVISIPSRRLTITKYNIDQDEVQEILKKYPKYAHNFELVEGGGVQVGTMLEGGDVDLLADAPEVPAQSKPSAKATKTKSAKGTKKK